MMLFTATVARFPVKRGVAALLHTPEIVSLRLHRMGKKAHAFRPCAASSSRCRNSARLLRCLLQRSSQPPTLRASFTARQLHVCCLSPFPEALPFQPSLTIARFPPSFQRKARSVTSVSPSPFHVTSRHLFMFLRLCRYRSLAAIPLPPDFSARHTYCRCFLLFSACSISPFVSFL